MSRGLPPHTGPRLKQTPMMHSPAGKGSRDSRPLEEAVRLHQAGRGAEAQGVCQQILRTRPDDFGANLLLGTMFLEGHQFSQACTYLERARRLKSKHPRALHYLALALSESGKVEESLSIFHQALAIESHRADLWLQAGVAYDRTNRLTEARSHYLKAISLSPKFAEAIHSLGDLERRQGNLELAIARYRQAIEAKPDFAPSHNNLAATLKMAGRHAEAIVVFARTMELSPQAVEPKANIAVCLAELGRFSEAMEHLADAYRLAPNHPLVHESLGKVHYAQGRTAQARLAMEEAIRLNPRSAEPHLILGQMSLTDGKNDEAETHFRKALALHPSEPTAATGLARRYEQTGAVSEARSIFRQLDRGTALEPLWNLRAASVCPVVFSSESAIDDYRGELEQALRACREADLRVPVSLLGKAGIFPPFNLPFHGRDDRPLKSLFGTTVQAMLPGIDQPAKRRTSGKVRIGFLTLQNERTFLRSIGGLMARFSNPEVEPIVIAPSARVKSWSSLFRDSRVQLLGLPHPLPQIVETIKNAELDLLYSFEIGTTPISYLLAHHRLAPVQCTSWGIQVTSGVPTVDHYLSSRWTEPQDAEAHYSERLHLLDTLLSWQEPIRRMDLSSDRERFGIPSTAHVYLCPQQIGKFTPAFDGYLAAILRADGEGHLVITQGTHPELAEQLHQRMRLSMPDVCDRVQVIKQQVGRDYWSMFHGADVVLDPIAFGGVNTTYDALAMGKAIVTLPSSFQRGRYTSGCYRVMGMESTIVSSREEYVERAVRLACDEDIRTAVEAETIDRRDVLYCNPRSVLELEETLLRLAHEARCH